MSFQTIIPKTVLTRSDLKEIATGNTPANPHPKGVYYLYQSGNIPITGTVNEVQVTLDIEDNLPNKTTVDPSQDPIGYNIDVVIEGPGPGGKRRAFHSLIDGNGFPGATEPNVVTKRFNTLTFGPNVETADTPIDVSTVQGVIQRDHRKEHNIPSDFSVCVLVKENLDEGEPGQFESVAITLGWEATS